MVTPSKLIKYKLKKYKKYLLKLYHVYEKKWMNIQLWNKKIIKILRLNLIKPFNSNCWTILKFKSLFAKYRVD